MGLVDLVFGIAMEGMEVMGWVALLACFGFTFGPVILIGTMEGWK